MCEINEILHAINVKKETLIRLLLKGLSDKRFSYRAKQWFDKEVTQGNVRLSRSRWWQDTSASTAREWEGFLFEYDYAALRVLQT